jgi:TRAP-type transport system periplasmic protein
MSATKLLRGALVAGALAGLASPVLAQVKIVYSTYLPETYSTTACDTFFMNEVMKRTDNAVTFERYYASSLLNAVDTLPGVGRGAADVGTSFPGGYNRAQYPLSNIALPFITENAVAATLALNELHKESAAFQSEYEKQGVKLLYTLIPDGHTVWSREPIRTAADVKGKRIRGLLATGDALAKMGGTVVAMQWPDGVEAMNRGAIDAFANAPFDLGVKAGLNKVSSYVSDVGKMGTYAASATVINLRKWNTLDPKVQETMLQVAGEVPDCFFNIVKKDVATAVETLLKDDTTEVVTFSDEESQKLRDTIGRELWQEWVTWVGKSGYDGQTILDRYLELVAKHEKTSTYPTGFEQYKQKRGG